jgi:Phosphorylase superfamily
MRASRAWVKRNLGFDPIATPAPPESFAHKIVATPRARPEDIQREIIDFDSEGPEGAAFFAFSTATGLSRFTEIPWPKSLAPKTDAKARKGKAGALPKADVLVVTWTVDEGHALSRVLTPGKDSRNDYAPYRHNFAGISKKMRKGCPALEAGRVGTYWTTSIAGKKVVVFKSDSHLSQDVKKAPTQSQTLPNEDVWRQIVAEVNPRLVITTGTAGGIGTECEVGDVVVSRIVRFDCQNWLKKEPFAAAVYRDGPAKTKYFAKARVLFKANSGQLPPDNTRPPKIVVATKDDQAVLTTDFFGFDNSDNHWKLQGLGSVCEMGDVMSRTRRSRPRAHARIRPTWQRRSTRDSAAGAPSAAESSAGH